jgi:transcriptional regulator of arginine metabolism
MSGGSRAAARRGLVRRLLAEHEIGSQEELAAHLVRHGHEVTQTTISRDLAALGAAKRISDGGRERYVLPDVPVVPSGADDLARLLRQFAVEVEASGNLALVKTLPGSAGPVATALDRATVDGVLGTVAGDDTVLVVARHPNGGAGVARRLDTLLGGPAPRKKGRTR